MTELETILLAIRRIEDKIDGLARANNKAAAKASIANAPAKPATDADLDGPRGNPEVRFEPKAWKGAPMRGRRFSDCDPDFLDQLAAFKLWQAKKDDDAGAAGEVDAKGYPKSGKWARVDAGLAAGWAARIRAGGHAMIDANGADDVPF